MYFAVCFFFLFRCTNLFLWMAIKHECWNLVGRARSPRLLYSTQHRPTKLKNQLMAFLPIASDGVMWMWVKLTRILYFHSHGWNFCFSSVAWHGIALYHNIPYSTRRLSISTAKSSNSRKSYWKNVFKWNDNGFKFYALHFIDFNWGDWETL